MKNHLLFIGCGVVAKCFYCVGWCLNRIGDMLFGMLNCTYGASTKLFDEAIRLYGIYGKGVEYGRTIDNTTVR